MEGSDGVTVGSLLEKGLDQEELDCDREGLSVEDGN